MKTRNFITVKLVVLLFFLLHATSCENEVTTPTYSELSPSSVVTNQEGIQAVLNSAYANAHLTSFDGHVAFHWMSTLSAGQTWNRGGSIEVWFEQYSNFTHTSEHRYTTSFWSQLYQGVRDANIVLANIENESFSNEFIQQKTAEAKFIRGWCNYTLYMNFGPLILFTSPDDDPLKTRASEEETIQFIEQDLTDALQSLSDDTAPVGEASKGTARAVLTKFYLNTKQWQKAADMAQEIIDMGTYGLVEEYPEIFAIENEGNKEILWALPRVAPEVNNLVNALTFPPDYPYPEANAVFAANTYLFDSFVNSFDPNDERREVMITEYTNQSGEHVQLLGNDQTYALKYPWDPGAAGQNAGNDIISIRYADILLARAEALNELNGPTQEAIDLINQVRDRAEVPALELGDFTQESLREHILQEREWEFFFEGQKAREDQIRHGVFIERAQERGRAAQPHHVLFPIPQTDIDANPDLQQNEGY